ncbi:hypothetical protein A2U01_0007363, partial [Trifolium medium]|nr:hypothetical protein [Trifolium medium]
CVCFDALAKRGSNARLARDVFFMFLLDMMNARLARDWPLSEGFSLCLARSRYVSPEQRGHSDLSHHDLASSR